MTSPLVSPATPASPWTALLPVALAGTRRQPLAPLPGLTPTLGTEAGAPEKQLLLTAANLRLVQRAGQRPLPGPATDLGRPLLESWPPLSATSARHFAELLPLTENLYILLPPVLRQLHRQRRRLPHRLLRPALNRLVAVNRETLLADYAAVFGQRGQWLAGLHASSADLRREAARAAASLRPGATLAERPAALTELLADDPAQAWQYVLTTLPTADDATRQQLLHWVWLVSFYHPLPAALAPVLEQPALPPYTYAGWREADPLAVATWRVLPLVPGSAWAGRLWERAAGYLVPERPLGQPPRLRLTLPPDEAVTETWRQDGFRADSESDANETNRRWGRLRYLLRQLPPSGWAAAWGVSLDEAVELLTHLPKPLGYGQPSLLEDWLQAAWKLHDVPAARALLAHVARSGQYLPTTEKALTVLPPAEQAALLQAALPAPPSASDDYYHLWRHWTPSILYDPPELPLEVAQVLLAIDRDLLPQPMPAHHSGWPLLISYQLLTVATLGPLALLPWCEAELLPLARARPELAGYILPSLTHLRTRQGLADGALEPPGPDW